LSGSFANGLCGCWRWRQVTSATITAEESLDERGLAHLAKPGGRASASR
jgi:hypothetical protein